MTRRTLFSLLLLVLILPGCDSSTSEGDAPEERPLLLPLDTGNEWVMEFTRFDSERTLTDAYTDTLRVVSDTTVAGERWAEIRCAQTRALCIPGGFYTNREDGVWKWNDPTGGRAPYLLYKYPAEVGDAYDQPSCCSDLSVTVIGTEDPIETPSGMFSAYHYEFDTDEINGTPVSDEVGRFDRYLVPGRGFASLGCSYVSLREDGWETVTEFEWRLISFDAP